MGKVYRAEKIDSGQIVAIKRLNNPGSTSQALTCFQRECQLMASLTHPHIVSVYGSGRYLGQDYLVMEYVAGSSLRRQMRPGKPWPTGRAARVLEAIAKALSYIHDKGILHLDLKPENVLCTANGDVKITDFGLALSLLDVRTLFDLGLAEGTLDYCSPEQWHGLCLDRRSDVFSLCTLAYELLTGRLPRRIYAPATRYNPHLPSALDHVLRQGLSRDASERYGSVEEFHAALTATLSTRPWWRRVLHAHTQS
jgi:serine/threonine-protein kinase